MSKKKNDKLPEEEVKQETPGAETAGTGTENTSGDASAPEKAAAGGTPGSAAGPCLSAEGGDSVHFFINASIRLLCRWHHA